MPANQSIDQPGNPSPTDLRAISPALRKRLQACYERANAVLEQDKARPDRDYAHNLLTECVLQDPANLQYVSALLENLQLKFKNNKRGARFGGFGGRGAIKKAVTNEDWNEVFHLGLARLKSNPWDVPTLRALANACKANQFNEVELRYLKNALDVNAKDPDVCRHCAESLARMGQFDQAIALWHRIEEMDKNNAEARAMISELSLAKQRGVPVGVESTVSKAERASKASGGSGDERRGSESASPPASGEASESGKSEERLDESKDHPTSATEAQTPDAVPGTPGDDSEIAELQRRLESLEAEPDDYLRLAAAHTADNRFRDALTVLRRGVTATSGAHLGLLEAQEDAQIRLIRSQVSIAEARAERDPSAEAVDLARRFRVELNRQEIEVFSIRRERYPQDMSLAFELGARLKLDQNFQAAREAFAEAQTSPTLCAVATLELGECLQHLKRYAQALKAYQSAAKQAGQGSETQKRALYRLGVLATALKNLEAAKAALQKLLKIDANYRDAAARLDKAQKIGDSG